MGVQSTFPAPQAQSNALYKSNSEAVEDAIHHVPFELVMFDLVVMSTAPHPVKSKL